MLSNESIFQKLIDQFLSKTMPKDVKVCYNCSSDTTNNAVINHNSPYQNIMHSEKHFQRCTPKRRDWLNTSCIIEIEPMTWDYSHAWVRTIKTIHNPFDSEMVSLIMRSWRLYILNASKITILWTVVKLKKKVRIVKWNKRTLH